MSPRQLFLVAAAAASLSAASAAASSSGAAAGGLAAPLSCGATGPSYAVWLDGAPLFTNPPALAAFAGGAWASSWVLFGAANSTGSDALGAFAGTQCAYAFAGAPGVPALTVAAFTYAAAAAAPSASIVRFRYEFPQGAPATNHSAKPAAYSTVANFPGFAGPGSPLPNVLTWRDAFFGPSNDVRDTRGQIASVAVFYGADVSGRVAVLSPLDNFLNSALGDDLGGAACADASDAGCWVAGASSTVTSLPPNFAHNFVLVADSGVTRTMDSWGRALRGYYGSSSDNRLDDTSVNTIGYTTDNGAQLCFGCQGPLDACLLEEKAYLDKIGMPHGYLSFQNDWWTSTDESAPWCVGEWVAPARKVPMGMAAFQQAYGKPLQLYAPYFCDTSDYAKNFSMIKSDTSLPGCGDMSFWDASPEGSVEFYEFLFSLGQSYGMTMYEPDFLNANHVCVPRFIEEIGAAEMFFGGQAGVALAKGIPIQWCFCTPMLLMWTLNAPAVTNFRVSYDFYYGGSWDIGRSSLIVWAMGKAPSKDTFWSTDNGAQATTRGGCDRTGCPADHSTPAAVLHTMLTVLSAGPVQFSDAPNETDKTLLMRTCDSVGNLLQPSKPLTAIDSTHDVTPGAAPTGFAMVTHTEIQGGVWLREVVSHQMTKDFALRALDVYPPLTQGNRYAVSTWAAVNACATGAGACDSGAVLTAPADAHAVVGTLPKAVVQNTTAPFTDAFSPTLTLMAPVCVTTGLALWGEFAKFATISIQRFTSVTCSPAGVAFGIAGNVGEEVGIAWTDTAASKTSAGSYTFTGPANGRGSAQCEVSAAGLVCA